MRTRLYISLFLLLASLAACYIFCSTNTIIDDDRFVTYVVNTQKQNLGFYWQNEKHLNYKSILNLKNELEEDHKKLIFAMNGGMYNLDHTPQGLYIENQIVKAPLDTVQGAGNFYLKPNGVFYITMDRIAHICATEKFDQTEEIMYATQSGPLLVIDGELHSAFIEGSKNLNIRNGVGVINEEELVFVMSKKEINFYDFAMYFKKLGCKNALYLDGFVSRTYLPQKSWIQTDGDFGVIIGVTEDQ